MKMKDILHRFPHLSEQIFQKLDSESLLKCREVSNSWQNVIDGRNYPWLHIVNIPTILKNGNNYIHLAAKTGQIEPFKTTLTETEYLSINEGGETPFLLACKNGHLKIVKLILKNLKTALEVLKGTGFEINYILDYVGTYINSQNKYGNTALHLACIRGLSDVVKILMEDGAVLDIYPNTKNNCHQTAFLLACQKGHINVAKIFIEYASTLNIDLNAKTKKGNTAFHLA